MENFDTVPSEKDWANYEFDIFANSAHNKFIGKTVAEMLPYFEQFPLSAGEDLCNMPPIPFRYYIFGFVRILTDEWKFPSGPLRSEQACFIASAFLDSFIYQLKQCPKAASLLIDELLPVVQYVVANPDRFDEDRAGLFQEKLEEIVLFTGNSKFPPT